VTTSGFHDFTQRVNHGPRICGLGPHNTLPDELRSKVVELARTKYQGWNHQHLSEQLNSVEDIEISRSSVRRIVVTHGRPLFVYHDVHTIFKPPKGEPQMIAEQLEGR